MRKLLDIGDMILLNEIGTKNKKEFVITEHIGTGASCIVYTAEHKDGDGNAFSVRLKEFYPIEIDIERVGNDLIPSDQKVFDEMLRYFTSGYTKQLEFRNNPEQMNSISDIHGVYEGNNTRYIAMSCNTGKCLTVDNDISFIDIMRIVCTVTKQIRAFHDKGYLYLDMKPNNIFLYPETYDMVMLFDFDSVISKEDVTIHSEWLSYTEEWSAPELSGRKTGKIDERTDIYSIGALLLFLLFKRSPAPSDRRRWASWNNDISNSIVSLESPENQNMVKELLKKTLSVSVSSRFSSCNEILDIIEPFLEKILAPKPYLKTFLPMGNNYFCGRDKEISEIHESIEENNILVMHGIGGIGKTELAKHYAKKYSDNYDAVVFVRFQGSIKDTIINDVTFPIVNCKIGADESSDEYYDRKMQVLHEICTDRHLIIIDNFDIDECDDMDRILELPCKMIFTSRIDQSDVFPQIEIDVLSDMESIRDIFRHYTHIETDYNTDQIIYALNGHTMGVELVARQMKITGISSEDMYRRLTDKGISATPEQIRNFKDGSLRNKSALKHLEILFTVFELSDEQQFVLSYFSMIGTTPVTREQLIALCEFEDKEMQEVDDAVHGGWVQLYEDTYQLHPLICEVLLTQLNPEIEDVWILIKNLIEDSEENVIQHMNAEDRFRRELIMFHVEKHIHGEPVILHDFLKEAEKLFADYGRYDKAEQVLLRRMELGKEVWPDDDSEYVYEYLDLSEYAAKQGDLERSEHYRQIADERIPDEHSIEVAYHLAMDDGDYETAKKCALELLECAKTYEEYYDAYSYLTDTEISIGDDPEQVVKYAKEAYRYAELCIEEASECEPEEKVDLWGNAGEYALTAKQYHDAIECYNKATEYITDNEDHSTILHIKIGLASSYAAIDEKNKAMVLLAECVEFAKYHYLPDHPKYTEVINVCAGGYRESYKYSGDTEYLHGHIQMMELNLKAEKDIEMLINYELSIAESQVAIGEYDEAEKHTLSACSKCEEYYTKDSPELIQPLSFIWQLLYSCDNPDYIYYFDLMNNICEENDMDDFAEDNRELLESLLYDD